MFRTRVSRWGSPSIFAGILIAFLLPFATVSCDGEEVAFTGVQLATWQVPPAEIESGKETLAGEIERESSHWAFVALVAAGVGLGLGVAGQRGGGIAAAIGITAMVLLLWDVVVTLATVEIHAGFALSFLGYIALAVAHAEAARRRRRAGRGTCPQPRNWGKRVAVSGGLALLALAAVAGCSAVVAGTDGYAEPEYVDFDTTDADPAWSPDGREIAFARDEVVYEVNPDGSCPRRVTHGRDPAWSPTGDKLALTRCDGNACSIVVVSRDGSAERTLVSGRVSNPRWSADGSEIYLSRAEADMSTATWVVRADGAGLRRLTPPWVAKTDARWSIAAASEADPTFSPDGTRYAFASVDEPTIGIDESQEAIFVRSILGGGRLQLSDPPANAGDYDPAWSPNGKQISFQRSGEIAVMNADGSHERVLTSVNGASASAWSPDSTKLVFTRELYGGATYFGDPSALMVVDVDSGDSRRLTWGPAPVSACKSG